MLKNNSATAVEDRDTTGVKEERQADRRQVQRPYIIGRVSKCKSEHCNILEQYNHASFNPAAKAELI